jgi:hypothetical protein
MIDTQCSAYRVKCKTNEQAPNTEHRTLNIPDCPQVGNVAFGSKVLRSTRCYGQSSIDMDFSYFEA